MKGKMAHVSEKVRLGACFCPEMFLFTGDRNPVHRREGWDNLPLTLQMENN